MGYLVYGVVIAIAVVLFIFTGVWGGLVWIVLAGIALAVVLLGKAKTVRRTPTDPSGVTRSSTGSGGTANERVGQS